MTTACIMMTSIAAQSQKTIRIYEGDAPYNKPVSIKEEIKAASATSSATITKITIPKLEFYKTDKGENAPCVIICPGGGYKREAYDHEGIKAAQWLNKIGISAFVLKYRLPDTALVTNAQWIPLMDAQQAINLIRTRSSEFNIDPTKVGIMGFSAGGHLAGLASNLFTLPQIKASPEMVRPDFSILIYAVTTMVESYGHAGSRTELLGSSPSEDLMKQFSLELRAHSNTPPTLIIQAADDKTVNIKNCYAYSEALQKLDVPVTTIVLPKGGHGFGFTPNRQPNQWFNYIQVWLNASKILNN